MKSEQILTSHLLTPFEKCPRNLQTKDAFNQVAFVVERKVFSDMEKADEGHSPEKEAGRGPVVPCSLRTRWENRLSVPAICTFSKIAVV